MRAFVTGGSGFLGHRLIEVLKHRGDEVRALARSDGAVASVERAGAVAVRGDLDDAAAIERGMAGCDVAFHSAASLLMWGDRREVERVNVGGTERVIASARATGVKKLVHVSTEAVLVGGRPIVRADESWPRPAHPIGLYPLTKGMAEERVLAANGGALTTVIVRPRFIWGPNDSILPKISESVKRGVFKWIGGGHHLTSTCHVDNVVHGMLLAAERGVGGQIYFLTDGEPVEVRAFLTALLATTGVDASAGDLPRWMARAASVVLELVWKTLRLSGKPPVTRAEVRLIGEEVTVVDEKARRELGYAPVLTRDEGLEQLRASLRRLDASRLRG
jgi:nucleoside-diphosphate-sugar epimerase